MKNKTVLVTGGAGYIGSRLTEKIIQSGYFVHILDNAAADLKSLKSILPPLSARYFHGSITEKKVLAECIRNVDFVIHLAGVSDGRAGKNNPELTKKTNSDSINGLLESSKEAGVQRFLFASTMGVYGNMYTCDLSEDLLVEPIDPYSESKAICEQLISKADDKDFTTASLRIAMVYGAGPKTRLDFLVNSLCYDAVKKGKLTMLDGNQRRPQIYLDDLCDIFILMLSCEKKLITRNVFNAVESNPSLSEIILNIREVLPETALDTLSKGVEIDSFVMRGDKLKKTLGYEYKTDLREGIINLINFFQRTG